MYSYAYSESVFSTLYIDIKQMLKKNFFRQIIAVPYLEPFWSQYTALGSQTQARTLKRAKNNSSRNRQMTIQSHESNVLSYSECRIANVFWGFSPGPHWGGLIAPHRHLGKKNSLFLLLQAPAHHSFIFNLQFLYELKHKVCLSKIVGGILYFLFNKMHGLFHFKT